MKKVVKCAVFATNANGEPDIFFCLVECSQNEYEDGQHYSIAAQAAMDAGYTPALIADENDPAGVVMSHAAWETIPTYRR